MSEKRKFSRRTFLRVGGVVAVVGLAKVTGVLDYLAKSIAEPEYTKATIADILDNPLGYDGKHVEFSGKPTLVCYMGDHHFHLRLRNNEGRELEARVPGVPRGMRGNSEEAERDISSLIGGNEEVSVKVVPGKNEWRRSMYFYLTAVKLPDGKELQLGKKNPTLTDSILSLSYHPYKA